MFKRTKEFLARHLTTIATFITTAVTIYIFSRIYFHWEVYRQLEPNEWGDFFAGAFGPIAFFWLVLGYFLQASELRATVEAQEKLANQSEEQLNFEREKNLEQTRRQMRANFLMAHPRVDIKVLNDDQGNQKEAFIDSIILEVINIGQPAIDYRIDVKSRTHGFKAKNTSISNRTDGSHLFWPTNSIIQCSFQPTERALPIEIKIEISYIDQDQAQRETIFCIEMPNEIDASVTKAIQEGWSTIRYTW